MTVYARTLGTDGHVPEPVRVLEVKRANPRVGVAVAAQLVGSLRCVPKLGEAVGLGPIEREVPARQPVTLET